MRNKKWFLCSLLACLLLATEAETRDKQELTELIAIALAQNPELGAAQAEAEAAFQRIPQATAWEDPMLGFQASDLPVNSFSFSSSPMSGKDISFSQTVPFPGKHHAHKQVMRLEAQATHSLSEEAKNRIRFEVKEAYFTLYRLEKGIGIVRNIRGLLSSLASVAELRYAAGQSRGPDVFRAQTLSSQLKERLLVLEQERDSKRVWLNTLLNLPADTPVKLKYNFESSKLPQQSPDLGIIAGRPLLNALEQQVESSQHKVTAAKRDYWPDLTLGVNYRQRDLVLGDMDRGVDLLSVGVQLNIPLWAHWRQGPKLKEEKAHKLATEFNYRAARNETLYRANDLYERAKRLSEQLKLYRHSLLPQARATSSSEQTAYEAKQSDFFAAIEALKDRYEVELAYYEIMAEYEISLAELEWMYGPKQETSL